MRRRFLGLLVLAAASALAVAGVAAADHPGGGGTPFFAQMSGDQECARVGSGFVCGNVGDPNGTGTAELRLNQGQGEICFELTLSGIDAATAGHIHKAPAGEAGSVFVPLFGSEGPGAKCVSATKAQIKEIRRNPELFYVNVHTATFPNGAVRGQLGD